MAPKTKRSAWLRQGFAVVVCSALAAGCSVPSPSTPTTAASTSPASPAASSNIAGLKTVEKKMQQEVTVGPQVTAVSDWISYDVFELFVHRTGEEGPGERAPQWDRGEPWSQGVAVNGEYVVRIHVPDSTLPDETGQVQVLTLDGDKLTVREVALPPDTALRDTPIALYEGTAYIELARGQEQCVGAFAIASDDEVTVKACVPTTIDALTADAAGVRALVPGANKDSKSLLELAGRSPQLDAIPATTSGLWSLGDDAVTFHTSPSSLTGTIKRWADLQPTTVGEVSALVAPTVCGARLWVATAGDAPGLAYVDQTQITPYPQEIAGVQSLTCSDGRLTVNLEDRAVVIDADEP